VLVVEGNVEGRVEKWPTLKKMEQKRERRRDRQLGEKEKWMRFLHADVAHRSLRLMTVDAWKPASSVDPFYKKGRFISEPAFEGGVQNPLGHREQRKVNLPRIHSPAHVFRQQFFCPGPIGCFNGFQDVVFHNRNRPSPGWTLPTP